MEFFKVLSAKDVYTILQKQAGAYETGTENADLLQSAGRTVSNDLSASMDLPEFNRSTVDGYAVISRDITGASESVPGFLECIYEVLMGEKTDFKLKSGQTAYVPTGGMIPEGADGMVMIEYTEKLDEKTILIHKPVAPGENMTFTGDDLKKGEVVVKKGRVLTPYDIGLLAGLGINKVNVYKKPVFSIISTGDEIIDIDKPQKTGQIRDINGYVLSVLISQIGGEVFSREIVKDDFEKLKDSLTEALAHSDIILISGGSSVGTRDYTKKVIESFENGEVFVHGISIKQGKPTIIGKIGNKLVFGLPGHPASAIIVFNRFVHSYIQSLLNMDIKPFSIKAYLDSNIHSSPGKETYQMVQLIKKEDRYSAVPLYAKSGMMTLLARASGYILIPDDTEGLLKGELVDVYLLQEINI